MTTSNRNGRVLYRYGLCLNDQCTKCKSKEVQEIGARKEFVCAECGKQHRECPRPKTWWEKNGKIVIIAAVVVILGAAAGCFALMGDDKKTNENPKDESVKVDTTIVEKPVMVEEVKEKEEPKEEKPVEPVKVNIQNGHGTIELDYGTYTGDLRNGKPNGHGVMKYKKQYTIIPSKNIIAQPGDSFEGEFRDGRVSGPGYLKHNGTEQFVKP